MSYTPESLRAQGKAATNDMHADDNSRAATLKPNSNEVRINRIAKKSTGPDLRQAPVAMRQSPAAATRRQVALASIAKKTTRGTPDKFMENFDPEKSARERRKLNRLRKVNEPVAPASPPPPPPPAPARRLPGAEYDENGIHIATGMDMCDCYQKACTGCHFPCPKCKSLKCGPECRCNRKFTYEQMEFQGCDLVVECPFYK